MWAEPFENEERRRNGCRERFRLDKIGCGRLCWGDVLR